MEGRGLKDRNISPGDCCLPYLRTFVGCGVRLLQDVADQSDLTRLLKICLDSGTRLFFARRKPVYVSSKSYAIHSLICETIHFYRIFNISFPKDKRLNYKKLLFEATHGNIKGCINSFPIGQLFP